MRRHVSFRVVSTSLRCVERAQTGQQYSATERHSAVAVVLMVWGHAPQSVPCSFPLSSIEPMSYMSRVSCAFIAQLFRTLRAHWRLSKISRLLFLLMAILHKSVRIAMCSRAGRGSWFAMRYAAALAHLVGRHCSSLMMDMWKVARVSMDRLSRTMLSSPYMKTGSSLIDNSSRYDQFGFSNLGSFCSVSGHSLAIMSRNGASIGSRAVSSRNCPTRSIEPCCGFATVTLWSSTFLCESIFHY